MDRLQTLREGEGIFQDFVRYFSAGTRKHAPPVVRSFLDKTKGQTITGIQAGRVPISSNLQKVFNVLTFGDYERQRNRLGYNDIYHSFVVVTLNNGQRYKIEKNNVVSVAPYHPKEKDQLFQVHLTSTTTPEQLLENAENYQEKNDQRPNFWTYDHENNNCQYFVDDILKGNKNIMTNEQQASEFTVQPEAYKTVQGLNKTLPFIKHIPNATGALHRFYYGSGFKQPATFHNTRRSYMYRNKPY